MLSYSNACLNDAIKVPCRCGYLEHYTQGKKANLLFVLWINSLNNLGVFRENWGFPYEAGILTAQIPSES